MSHVTVKQLAEVVGAPVDRLLEQIKQAGLEAEHAESPISDDDKMKLLDFLRNSHGRNQAEGESKQKITLKRKSTSEIKLSGAGHKTVNVEIRKKRTYVKREDVAVSPEKEALDRLMAEVDQRQIWREEGLTIGALATRLAIPEYQLRRLINEGLGYRNFTAFINERRIAAAKQMLSDPAARRSTVATIAFEVGFASLGPFNRAFRDATGHTPTEWRKAEEAGRSIPENSG